VIEVIRSPIGQNISTVKITDRLY